MKYDDKILFWVGKGSLKNHVRVLLCTLQDILWANSGWQRIGMDKLLKADEVKKAYRKAVSIVHPDRI